MNLVDRFLIDELWVGHTKAWIIPDPEDLMSYTAGVRKDGTVITAGRDGRIRNTVSQWTNIEHLYVGVGEEDQSLIGLRYDGTVVSTSQNMDYDVSQWKDVIDIAVGMYCVVGITGAGHVYFAGRLTPDLKEKGMDNCLCIGASLTGHIWVSRENEEQLFLLSEGVVLSATTGHGFLVHQTGAVHEIIVNRKGSVLVCIRENLPDFHGGQDDTEDWMMIEPNNTTQGGGTISNGGGENASEQGRSGKCYVATCVYGAYDCPQVWTLRRYRDDTLASTWYGRLFVHTYYAISPTLVKLFGDTNWFKKFWRGKLDHMVAKLRKSGVEDTPYEAREW